MRATQFPSKCVLLFCFLYVFSYDAVEWPYHVSQIFNQYCKFLWGHFISTFPFFVLSSHQMFGAVHQLFLPLSVILSVVAYHLHILCIICSFAFHAKKSLFLKFPIHRISQQFQWKFSIRTWILCLSSVADPWFLARNNILCLSLLSYSFGIQYFILSL